jgi:hypothetical protein
MGVVYLTTAGRTSVRLATTALAAAAAAIFWSARPQMISFVLGGVVLYVLELLKRRRVDRLWIIPPLMSVWANLHAGFFVAVLLLGGFLAGETLERLTNPGGPDTLPWRMIGKVALVGVAGYVALALNPYGAAMWTYAFNTLHLNVLQRLISEWGTPDFHNPWIWPFALLLLLTLAGLGRSGLRSGWSELVLVAGMGFMALYAGRSISTFAIVAAPVCARHWSAVLGAPRAATRPARAGAALPGLVLLACIVAAVVQLRSTLAPAAIDHVQRQVMPIDAAEFLARARPPGPMFNTYNNGGYLMWAIPGQPVFVDGRTDLYGDALLSEWLAAARGQSWRPTFEKWGIRLAVVENDFGVAAALQQEPGWEQVFRGQRTSVFTRRAP